MIPLHDWVMADSDNVWKYWRCTICPPGTHKMMQRIKKEVTLMSDDHKVSTCPQCGNYSCICLR